MEYFKHRKSLKKLVKLKKKEFAQKQIEDLTESNSWDKMWEIIGKWGVRRGESALRTRDGRELREGREWDKALLDEYHPALSAEEKSEWYEYTSEREPSAHNPRCQ